MAIGTGTTLADAYALGFMLGSGGASRVYQARQLSTGQSVAVKILQLDPALSAPARDRRIARFRREMRICARLDHPDVVRLIDHGQDGGVLFSVFELVSGQTLAQLLATEGALAAGSALSLMRQLLEVLVHAHGRGVIHRDLKPSNLMVLGEGGRSRIKVLDFGIGAIPGGTPGSSTDNPTRLTLSQEMVGTPAYAAPEQLRGEVPTAKTDLYAWGLVTLECLTGRPVMRGGSIGAIFQEQLSPTLVPLPAQLRAHGLGTLLQWVLSKDPARRAGSAAEVLARLDALADDALADLVDKAGYLRERVAQAAFAGGPPTATSVAGAAASSHGERRQVTALCCRLSLRSASDLDASLLDAYRGDLFALCEETVAEFGGAPVGGFGDLALYYFGVPQARDVDARLAARAVLELSARLRSRSTTLMAQSGVSVVLRAGLHSGVITTKESPGGGAVAHGSVATTAVALAEGSRDSMESAITASEAFRRLTRRHYEFSSVDGAPRCHLDIPGSTEVTPTHKLVSESLTAAFVQGVAPCVGREVELRALLDALRRSSGGVALVSGEAGIGKSRLLHELRQRAGDAGRGALCLRFLPEMQHVPQAALFELVTTELGLRQRPRCHEVVAALQDLRVELELAVPLLCEWTSTELEAPWTPLPYSPEKRRAMLSGVLTAVVTALLSQRAGYLQVEDLHWADPSTLDWLGLMFRSLGEHGGFAVMTARPDFAPPWEGVELLMLELAALPPDQVAAMVEGLPLGSGMIPAVIAQIVARADGVPLFVEELTGVFAEHLDGAPTGEGLPEVPATLRGLFMARLDALGEAKETVQVAAAIGREFDQDLLRASVISRDEATILADLDQLISSRIVLVQRSLGGPRFFFRHALLRDAAYESMTSASCEWVHGAVAAALLHEFPERVEARPDLVAHHLELAGLAFDAQSYWLRAGRLALRDIAYDEARAHLRRGLEVLARCPASAGHADAELDLLGAMSAAHIAKLGYGAKELGPIIARVEALTEEGSASPSHALPLLWGRYLYHSVQPDHHKALPLAKTMLERATKLGDLGFCLQGHSALVRNRFWRGEFAEALGHFDALSAHADPALIRRMLAITGEDPRWAGAGFSALALLITGLTAEGMALSERVAEAARDTGLPGLTQASWTGVAHAHLLRGLAEPGGRDLEVAIEYGRRAREGAAELGFPFWQGYGGLMEAAAMICRGQLAGIAQMEGMLAMFAGAGARVGLGWGLDTLAYGYMQAGDLDKAAETLARSRDHVERSGERFYASVHARFEAQLAALRSGAGDACEAKLIESIEIARRQGARLFEAQSMVQLLELFARQGRSAADQDALRGSASWRSLHGHDLASVPSLAPLF